MSINTREVSLVSIYHCGTREDTVYQLREAQSYMDDEDYRVAQGLLEKLEAMSNSTFATLVFDPEEVAV